MVNHLHSITVEAQVVVGLAAKDLPSRQFSYGFLNMVLGPSMVTNLLPDFGTCPPVVSTFMVRENNEDPG